MTKLEAYQQLIQLTEEFLQDVRYNANWDEHKFELYEQSWSRLKAILEARSQEKPSEDEKILCEQLKHAHDSLIDLISSKSSQLSDAVQGVRKNQTLFNAYYGLGRIDSSSIYFDEKK